MATEAKGMRVNLNGTVTDVLYKDETARNTLSQLTYPGHDQAIMGTDSYVCNVGQMFAATLNSNTLLTLADGEGVLQGVRFRIQYGSTVELTIDSGTSGYKRIDLVVARYTKSTGAINFVVIKGTNATSSPATPAYNTENVIAGAETVDFPLYKITIDGTTVSSVDKLFTQLQTMAELQMAVNKLNTEIVTQEFSIGPAANSNYYGEFLYFIHIPTSIFSKKIISYNVASSSGVGVIRSVSLSDDNLIMTTNADSNNGKVKFRFVLQSKP